MPKDILDFRKEDARYLALLDGAEVGFADVDPVGKDAVLIKHTEISPQYEGKGFAGQLMRHILEDTKGRGLTVVPVCPYAAAYIKRHPEYLDYVRPSYRPVLDGKA